MAGDSRTCICACAVAGPQLFCCYASSSHRPIPPCPRRILQPSLPNMTLSDCNFMLSHNNTAGYRAIP